MENWFEKCDLNDEEKQQILMLAKKAVLAQQLEKENLKLQTENKELVTRVAELEMLVQPDKLQQYYQNKQDYVCEESVQVEEHDAVYVFVEQNDTVDSVLSEQCVEVEGVDVAEEESENREEGPSAKFVKLEFQIPKEAHEDNQIGDVDELVEQSSGGNSSIAKFIRPETRLVINTQQDTARGQNTHDTSLVTSIVKPGTLCIDTGASQSMFEPPPVLAPKDDGQAPIKQYTCSICAESLIGTLQQLTDHMQTHDTRNVPCTLCSKVFSNKHILNSHMKSIHTARPEFACQICQKGYNNKWNLDRHMKEVHKHHKCTVCSEIVVGELPMYHEHVKSHALS